MLERLIRTLERKHGLIESAATKNKHKDQTKVDDIVINELDALLNIDFKSKKIKKKPYFIKNH